MRKGIRSIAFDNEHYITEGDYAIDNIRLIEYYITKNLQ